MGTLRNLKKDPLRVPRPQKLAQKTEEVSYQQVNYTPPSGMGVSFDSLLNGYIFSVDSVVMSSPAIPHHISSTGSMIRYATVSPSPTICVKEALDPSILQKVWNWTTSGIGTKTDGLLQYFSPSGQVNQKWRLLGCLFVRANIGDVSYSSYSNPVLTLEVTCDTFNVI